MTIFSEAPAGHVEKVTLANSNLPNGACRAIVCGTAGTFNFMDPTGVVNTAFPLQQGYNPIAVLQAQTGGSASDIWAIY